MRTRLTIIGIVVLMLASVLTSLPVSVSALPNPSPGVLLPEGRTFVETQLNTTYVLGRALWVSNFTLSSNQLVLFRGSAYAINVTSGSNAQVIINDWFDGFGIDVVIPSTVIVQIDLKATALPISILWTGGGSWNKVTHGDVWMQDTCAIGPCEFRHHFVGSGNVGGNVFLTTTPGPARIASTGTVQVLQVIAWVHNGTSTAALTQVRLAMAYQAGREIDVTYTGGVSGSVAKTADPFSYVSLVAAPFTFLSGGILLNATVLTPALYFEMNVTVVFSSTYLPLGFYEQANVHVATAAFGSSDNVEPNIYQVSNVSPVAPLLTADQYADSFYYTGLDSMFTTLYNPAPCLGSPSAIHEGTAPQPNFSWWADDNSKALEALASAQPSYLSGMYAPQSASILGLLSHMNVGGYFPSRCINIAPNIVNSTTLQDNLYYLKGNPTTSPSLFSISEWYNPTIVQAYLDGATVSLNGTLVTLDSGAANPIQNGGADTGNTNSWVVTNVIASSTYHHSDGFSFQLSASASLNQSLAAIWQPAVANVVNIQWWDTSSSGSQSYNLVVHYTDGTSTTISTAASPSTAPGTWVQRIIPKSALTAGKTVLSVAFTTTTGTGIYLDDIALNEVVGATTFTQSTSNGAAIDTEALNVNGFASVSVAFSLQPGKPYLLETSQISMLTVGHLNTPTFYNALDGLDTIGSGYAYVYIPGQGFIRPSGSGNQITQIFPTAGWNDNWIALDVHWNPDWIGANAIFIDYNQTNIPGGSGPWNVNQWQNTIFQNATVTGPGNYVHYFQTSMQDSQNVVFGSPSSFKIEYVFAISHDWTNMGVYKSFFSGNSLDTEWNGVYPAMNLYEGEIAYGLARFAQATGGIASPIAYPLAVQVWNYYYRMIQAETNGTYTGSLARWVDASIVLFQLTTNSTYLAGMNFGLAFLARMQWTVPTFLNPTRYNFHYCPVGCATVNTLSTSGNIFNATALWGSGRVLSGNQVAVNFFQSPVLSAGQNVSGTWTTTFYLDANALAVNGFYYTALQELSPTGVTTTIASSNNQSIVLPSGSGSAPFGKYVSTITVPATSIPSGYALVVQLKLSVPVGNTIFACFDSLSNCPSNVVDPVNVPALGRYGFYILPPASVSPTAATALPQPIFLDLSVLAGQAFYAGFLLTANMAYQTVYANALLPLKWADTPAKDASVGSIGSAMRIFLWSNATAVDSDYSTYKSALTGLFVYALNNTLGDIAVSRIWARVSPFTATNLVANIQEPLNGMNSETQPWCLIGWLAYERFEASVLRAGGAPLYMTAASQQAVILSTASTAVQITIAVNGTNPGATTIYAYTGPNSLINATFNGNPVGLAAHYVYQTGGPIPGIDYVWLSTTFPGTYVFNLSPYVLTGSVTASFAFSTASGAPLPSGSVAWQLLSPGAGGFAVVPGAGSNSIGGLSSSGYYVLKAGMFGTLTDDIYDKALYQPVGGSYTVALNVYNETGGVYLALDHNATSFAVVTSTTSSLTWKGLNGPVNIIAGYQTFYLGTVQTALTSVTICDVPGGSHHCGSAINLDQPSAQLRQGPNQGSLNLLVDEGAPSIAGNVTNDVMQYSVTWRAFVADVSGQVQMFSDNFLEGTILPISVWTMDATTGQTGPGTTPFTLQSGYMVIRSVQGQNVNLIHVNNPTVWSRPGAQNYTIVTRKLTVSLVPFSILSTLDTVDVGMVGLSPSGAAGTTNPYGTPCPANFCQSGVGWYGGLFVTLTGNGVVAAELCGALNDTGKPQGCFIQPLGTIAPLAYTVVTIKYNAFFTGSLNATQGSWVFFRVYQPGASGNSFDQSFNFTSANTNFRYINPTYQTLYTFIGMQTNGNDGMKTRINFVEWQNFGSPVIVTPPPPVPFPSNPNQGGLIGLFLLVAQSLGFGNAQLGALLEFLIFLSITVFPIALLTRSVLAASSMFLIVSAMFVYAGFIPTLVVFLELLAVGGIGFMTLLRIISGGDSGGGFLGSESEE